MSPQPRLIAITHATLIDGTGAPPLENAIVMIEDDRVVSVGSEDMIHIPEGADIIDAYGQWLLPGLIDAHVHVSAQEFIPIPPKGDPTVYMTIIAARNLRSALQAGITTVRDVCGPRMNLALRTAIERGQMIGPRIFTSGKGICMTGGHGSGDPSAVHQVDTPSAIRHAVREERRAGADFIKLLTSHRTEYPEFSQAEIDAGVDEAHRLGLRVAIHAANFVTTGMAARAGVDVIEHGSCIDEATMQLMTEKSIILVPTLWVKHDLAARLKRWKGTPEKFPWGDANDLEESERWFQRCVDQLPETIALARKHGVRMAAGTDFVMSDFPWALLHEEIGYMVQLGLTPTEAIESATRIGAEALGQEHNLGTVKPGKIADLIRVERNPLADITALANVNWVMKAGQIIPRSPEWDRRPISESIQL
ncbi:amidohydrolase family protein [Candidatus Bipolaricaulota bacterium]|nr:amidohydrolase family protein [Candidatus Bipolaricaulota bacterium]